MKRIQNLILYTLGVSLLLSLAACEQKDSGMTNEMLVSAMEAGAQPDGPVKPESETVENTEAAGGVVVDYRTEALAKAEATAPKPLTPLQQPPNITLSYQFKLGETGLVEMVILFPAGFSWTVEEENGVGKTTHVDALPPYDNEKTHRLKLERVADYGYMLDIGWQEAHIESCTVRAYPIGKYEEHHATACAVENGKLALLRGAYYYEWTVQYSQGTVTYGFFVE